MSKSFGGDFSIYYVASANIWHPKGKLVTGLDYAVRNDCSGLHDLLKLTGRPRHWIRAGIAEHFEENGLDEGVELG